MSKTKAKIQGGLGTKGDTVKVGDVGSILQKVLLRFGWGFDNVWHSLKKVLSASAYYSCQQLAHHISLRPCWGPRVIQAEELLPQIFLAESKCKGAALGKNWSLKSRGMMRYLQRDHHCFCKISLSIHFKTIHLNVKPYKRMMPFK